MILAARCPQCYTAFRIVPDQLKISEGWVRCGSCQHVFDAYTTQFETSRENLEQEKHQDHSKQPAATAEIKQPEPPTPPPVEPDTLSSDPTSVFPDSLLQEFRISGEDDGLEVIDDGADIDFLNSGLSISDGRDIAARPPLPTDVDIGLGVVAKTPRPNLKPSAPKKQPETERSKPYQNIADETEKPQISDKAAPAASSKDPIYVFEEHEEQVMPLSYEESSEIVDLSDLDSIDVVENGDFIPDSFTVSVGLKNPTQKFSEKTQPQPNIDIHQKDDDNEWVNALSSAFPSLLNSTIKDEMDNVNSKGDEVLERLSSSLHEQNISELSFVKNGQSSTYWQKPVVRRVCALLVFLCAVALLAQTLYLFRSQLYARFPELQAPLTGLCQSIGCTVGYPVDAGAVRIVQTVFESIDEQNYQLELLIRNDGQAIVAMPWVELTLTNASEQVIARKVFSPQALNISKTALQPKEELFIRQKITTDTQGVVSRNYSVLLFFP